MQQSCLHRELGRIRDSTPTGLFALVDDVDAEEEVRRHFVHELLSVECMSNDKLEALASKIAYGTNRVDVVAMSHRAQTNAQF